MILSEEKMTDWFYFAICRKKKLAPKPSRKVREISEEEESEDEGPASGKRKREVCRVLKTFNASPGFGDSLKKLPSIVQMKLLVS